MSSQKNVASFLRNIMVTFLPRATDEDLQNARILAYPKHIIYFIVSFIALISLCHFFSMFYHFIIRKRIHEWKSRTTVSFTRLPAAVADSFRTLAFRWTVPFGSSHELNFVEVGLTLAYMAILYTWALVNSMLLLFIPLTKLKFIFDSSHVLDGYHSRPSILRRSGRKHSCLSTANNGCPRHEEQSYFL
jgi:hypothetical protein